MNAVYGWCVKHATQEQREQFDATLAAPLGDERPVSKAAQATFTEDEEQSAFAAAYAALGSEQ